MVRTDVVGRKVDRAAAWLDDASKRFAQSAEDLESEIENRDLATFYLFLAIQECMDLCSHWLSDAGWGAADDAATAFKVLAERGAIDLELAQQLAGAVGLRNRIAHGYGTVDHSRIRSEFPEGVAALRRFLDRVSQEAGLAGPP